ncbi:MAG TPA: FKBP-type peptidyl-prolyl cis-trans isomerase [Candidatus Eisenbacteria bacterium]|jgi:FKBP-type peptidyl-prolyl cis-trans isomerase 2|nr:FKBP-type peptidyl-prolyl cis-trans isomerase [Candidatus Eisenbacteria bacterium]
MPVVGKGRKIRIAYELTVDGRLIKSLAPAKPYIYVQGKRKGSDIPLGLEKAIQGMRVGERRSVVLKPKQGYGVENPKSIMEMPRSRFAAKHHVVGKEIYSERDGKYLASVRNVNTDTLTLNFNHRFAGKALHYSVLVVGIDGLSAAAAAKTKR